jgi:GTP-binding protein
VLADVGLVGFPNAGKSTLLSVLSAAKPEIANYPFTTLTPQLGIVQHYDYKTFVMADIPGIIEGASEGKGLGLRFLRHIERNSTLLFLVNADSSDIFKEYKILLDELKKYNPELLDKKRILGISKRDLIDDELEQMITKDLNKRLKGKNRIPFVFFSSHTKENLSQLKELIWEQLNH